MFVLSWQPTLLSTEAHRTQKGRKNRRQMAHRPRSRLHQSVRVPLVTPAAKSSTKAYHDKHT
jgi:hypothetical protein